MEKRLYSLHPIERLNAAKQIGNVELERIQQDLVDGCPVKPWPYGSPMVVNPFIVTLGASPGDSPNIKDTKIGEPYTMPTAGVPHPGSYYEDSKRYWKKVRFLVHNTLQNIFGEPCSEDDALSLYGHLNIGVGQHGSAKDVKPNPDLANWALHTIRYKLRPRFIIMLGLKGEIEKKPEIRQVFEKVFPEFQLHRPDRKKAFGRYYFREWDVRSNYNSKMTLTLWPNHPSRVPFSNLEQWKIACHQFLHIDR